MKDKPGNVCHHIFCSTPSYAEPGQQQRAPILPTKAALKLFLIFSGGKGRDYWPGCYTQNFSQDFNLSLILIASSIQMDLLKSLRGEGEKNVISNPPRLYH